MKFINRRKQTRDETRKEYEILALIANDTSSYNNSILHSNMAGKSGVAPPCLIKSSGLFLTATSDAIVMNL